MAQSLSRIYIHIIFSTYGRVNCLSPSVMPQLWKYLAGVCQAVNCLPVKIGGTGDHVHILCELSRDITIQNLVRDLKSSSSKWLSSAVPDVQYFNWQKGYGAFSINPSEKSVVVNYIENQYEHHRSRSFQEEFMIFLKKYEADYNEKYLWD